jgi:altronate dehydratase
MTEPSVISVGEGDNVVIAVRALSPGGLVVVPGVGDLTVRDKIPFGHKLAVTLIPAGGAVVKYDEVIGVASADIPAGSHVHVHNVVSARLPGPTRPREVAG